MSSSGQRRRRDKQRNQRGRTQPYPLRNEQRHVQGDGASRVNPLRERDGASHNTSGGRIIDHTARSLNTVARHNTVSSGNTTITNSNNVEDNARTFNDSNFNEFDRSTFNGPVNFAENIYHSPQPGPPIPAPTHRDMEKLVQTIDWATLSRQLSVVDQDENRFKISPFDRNEPENFWISKNIDFTQWESANDSRALFLSAPPGHGTTEVCSHIIDLVKEKAALQTNSSVMYFFSSTATEARCSTVFTHTLLHQIVCCSSIEKADSIAATFLDTLLSRHLQRHTQVFTEDDQVNTTIQKILNAPKYELVEALVEAIKTGGIEELYIIVDGLSEDIARLVVKHGMRAIRKLKTLFTINESPRYRDMLDRITYIEYDKERKECLRSLHHDNTRYDKISEEHHGSLEWLWNHPQYLQWSASVTSSLLYIEGKPGSGKSTLAKYFVKNLEKVPNACSSTVAHYFYTFRGTMLESTHENMLRSILYSILRQDEAVFYHFQQEFRDFRRRNHSEWPYESLKRVLSSFANHRPTKPLYLILDAMDESEEDDRRNIIQLLCKLCLKENPCSIKIFLASRPVAELKHRIREQHHVIIMQDQNKDDICRFADDFLNTDLRLSGKILRDATEYITQNAQGVFVWVSLVRYELLTLVERGLPDAAILKCLKGLPKELEDFYNYMFHRLEKGHPQDIQDGKKLFRFVLVALRPLAIVELRDALALPDDHNPSYEDFQQNITNAIARRIEHCGGNFLEIKTDGTVQFMHQTAREFMIRTIPNASKLQFEVTDKAQRIITTTWVRYLMLCFTSLCKRDSFSKIKSWSSSDFQAYARYLNEWPLIEYSLRYIKEHYDLCGQNEKVSELVTTLVIQLADHEASCFLGSWMAFRFRQEIICHKHQATDESIKYNILDAAAELKLSRASETLLLPCTQDGSHPEAKTPLIISAQKGLAAATRLFLNIDMDKDAKDNSGRTALHHAAENGDEVIVRLLLEYKADKTIEDNCKERAIDLAIKKNPYDTKFFETS